MKQRRVVYTVLTGSKEYLNNPFPEYSHEYERICFTDNPDLKSDVWSIELLSNHGLDCVKEAKRPKILPHRFLPDFDISLYVDNTVRFKVDPNCIFNQYADVLSVLSPLTCFRHPWRNCAYEEGEEKIRLSFDDEKRMRSQLDFYEAKGLPKHSGLIATTVMLRCHLDPKMIEIAEEWFEHILRFPKRGDQMEFSFVAWHRQFKANFFQGSLISNDLIAWPDYNGVKVRVPADFDDSTYIWLNPEVAKSGLSARQHYLQYGFAQGLPYRTYTSELNRLANKYKTDKGDLYYNAHGYAAIYEQYLGGYREQALNLLELGLLRHDMQVRTDAADYDIPSLKMWHEYLPKASVFGFDIADFSMVPPLDKIQIFRGDMGKVEDLARVTEAVTDGLDVIIDDASHASHHQQIALGYLFQHLKDGGFYFIEDLHYQPQQLEIEGIVKLRDILKALERGILITTKFLPLEQLKYLKEHIEFIHFYDSQDRHFGRIFSDAFVVLRKTGGGADKVQKPLERDDRIYLIVDLNWSLDSDSLVDEVQLIFNNLLDYQNLISFQIVFLVSNAEDEDLAREIIFGATLDLLTDKPLEEEDMEVSIVSEISEVFGSDSILLTQLKNIFALTTPCSAEVSESFFRSISLSELSKPNFFSNIGLL